MEEHQRFATYGRRGRLPTRVINIYDEDRNPCITANKGI